MNEEKIDNNTLIISSPKAIIDNQANLSVQEESEEVKKSTNYLTLSLP